MIQTDPNQEFVCNFCHQKHSPGKDGFLLNGALMKLLKAKAGNVYRNEQVARLKEKLDEIKSKCEEFKLSLNSGVDQVSQHCDRLRNQVHLETDKLIKEAHDFNESLIEEINNYEVECIKCFKINLNKNENYIVLLEQFHSDKTKYLTEFELDERVVEEAVTKADSHLEQLKIEDISLKYTIFNGQEAQFIKRQNNIDRTLLGTLVYKSLSLDFTQFDEFQLMNNIITNSSSGVDLFKNHDGNNFAFYIDKNRYLNMTCFDNGKQVIKQVDNALKYVGCGARSQINQLKVTQSLNNFIFFVKLSGYAQAASICGHQIYNHQGIKGLFFILDQDFNYIKHNADLRNQQLLYMASNSSRVICIDPSYNYFLLDMDFVCVNVELMNEIKNQVGNTVIDVQMSDTYVFVLCLDNKLKI
jgi:cell division septum initiation protein DivIVA